ncbi:MAG TPA: helix-turn-helix domain-containing protein [Solirubrobacteraceae bacterium]|jgi:AcrR family transcriptional regulator|nr:helix-turn-helix domain-containing protein [Solirubrobacteraceae bacterium]
MATTSERPLRKDAERNRQRVLDAARELFAERGLGVSLDDIARHAGVGVGTVYRRFPDKEQLIDALFEERIGEMLSAAGKSLEMPDPWLALVRFLERALEMQAEDRGLKELLLSTSEAHARIERARLQIQPLVAVVLERAQQAGVVRADLVVADLLLLQHAIGEVADYTREVAPEVWRRTLVIALDGLRPDRRRTSPMPCPPLDDEEIVCSMRDWGARRRR